MATASSSSSSPPRPQSGSATESLEAFERVHALLRRYNDNPEDVPDMAEQMRALLPDSVFIRDLRTEDWQDIVRYHLRRYDVARAVIDRHLGAPSSPGRR
ncbi:hypothetical protein JDV02_005825 [Purpureocillium takamizusanense]|uniref:Uncharacterized protein n=1 Tax=Purpureocillium takamizusanense TaxID=2060973 RepID=A0A9Q8QHD6_9HYPO|nr:uncharacterized protein JDV02_005825 [Purpureocillium takamizusanense]UNI19650.1 hypothetical protein JDV02_005825 [Purpureocillium takamizusanense]